MTEKEAKRLKSREHKLIEQLFDVITKQGGRAELRISYPKPKRPAPKKRAKRWLTRQMTSW